MPKYRDWDRNDEKFSNNRRQERKQKPKEFWDETGEGFWDRKNENRSKWNKKHPGRR